MASSWGSLKAVFHSERKDQLLRIKGGCQSCFHSSNPATFSFTLCLSFLSANHSLLSLIFKHLYSSLVRLRSRAEPHAPGLSPFLLRAKMSRRGRMLGRLPHVRPSGRIFHQPRTNWVIRSWSEWGDGVKSFAKNKQNNKPTLMPTEGHNLTLSVCKLWCLLPPLWGQVSWL